MLLLFKTEVRFLIFFGILLQWVRTPGKKGSHFHPNSDLFLPNERKDVITSTACWTAMAALLVYLSFAMGPVQLLKLYGLPYWVGSIP
jgi:omega-3 fatty acid desaturase (delta-15 desaturase)